MAVFLVTQCAIAARDQQMINTTLSRLLEKPLGSLTENEKVMLKKEYYRRRDGAQRCEMSAIDELRALAVTGEGMEIIGERVFFFCQCISCCFRHGENAVDTGSMAQRMYKVRYKEWPTKFIVDSAIEEWTHDNPG